MSKEDFLTAVRDPVFLKELKVDAGSLEGYLFPDTYFLRPSERAMGRCSSGRWYRGSTRSMTSIQGQ